jgi:hypothetical protein
VPGTTVSAWEGVWTPEQLATGPPPQLLYYVLLLPRTDRWISCTVQIWWSPKARLPNYMYYSGMDFTYKLDRTTVTVGAPSILAISTSSASTGASSSASAATGPSAPVRRVLACFLLPTLAARQYQASVVPSEARSLLWWGLDCGSSQSLLPLYPSRLLPPDLQGRTMESPATRLSTCNASRQVLDYSTRGTYLLGSGLYHLQLLGDTFSRHIARPSRWRKETSLQDSRQIINEGDMG